jgi:hypothetical protein
MSHAKLFSRQLRCVSTQLHAQVIAISKTPETQCLCMYVICFNVKGLCPTSAKFLPLLCMILTISSDCVPKQHSPVCPWDWEAMHFLWSKKWDLEHYPDELRAWKNCCDNKSNVMTDKPPSCLVFITLSPVNPSSFVPNDSPLQQSSPCSHLPYLL